MNEKLTRSSHRKKIVEKKNKELIITKVKINDLQTGIQQFLNGYTTLVLFTGPMHDIMRLSNFSRLEHFLPISSYLLAIFLFFKCTFSS